jgi:uncharacterized membrane protein YgdD (TMEM256/DUF423 family)
MTTPKIWIFVGTLLAGTGVILGAFGAHALRQSLSERAMAVYQTGCQYQFIHALALILLGIWSASSQSNSLTTAAGWLFTVGTLLFSGSLYLLAITDIKILGAITPLGGLSFIAGWTCFAVAAWKAATT